MTRATRLGHVMKVLMLAATAALAAWAVIEPANAWMRGGGGFGGGFYHGGHYGVFEHATEVGPGGVAHESNAGGYWHGSAANGYGAWHGGDYGGNLRERFRRLAHRRLRRLLSSAGGREPLRRRLLELRRRRLRSARRSRREAEVHHVALGDDIVLAFEPELAGFARARFAAKGRVVVVSDGLGPDEAALEIAMDDAGGLGCLGALLDGPGARLPRPGG